MDSLGRGSLINEDIQGKAKCYCRNSLPRWGFRGDYQLGSFKDQDSWSLCSCGDRPVFTHSHAHTCVLKYKFPGTKALSLYVYLYHISLLKISTKRQWTFWFYCKPVNNNVFFYRAVSWYFLFRSLLKKKLELSLLDLDRSHQVIQKAFFPKLDREEELWVMRASPRSAVCVCVCLCVCEMAPRVSLLCYYSPFFLQRIMSGKKFWLIKVVV